MGASAHRAYLLSVEDEWRLQVLQRVGVDLVLSLGRLLWLSLTGNITGPVTGLEIVAVDQTTYIFQIVIK